MLVNLVGSSGFKMYSLNSNTEILKGMEVSFYISKGEKKIATLLACILSVLRPVFLNQNCNIVQ